MGRHLTVPWCPTVDAGYAVTIPTVPPTLKSRFDRHER
jgi:hypothetical protein